MAQGQHQKIAQRMKSPHGQSRLKKLLWMHAPIVALHIHLNKKSPVDVSTGLDAQAIQLGQALR
jgi:hypothetical protein